MELWGGQSVFTPVYRIPGRSSAVRQETKSAWIQRGLWVRQKYFPFLFPLLCILFLQS